MGYVKGTSIVGLRIMEHKSCCLGKIDDALTGLEFHIEQELLQVTVAFCAALDRYHGAVLQADARNGRLQEFQFIKALQRTVQLVVQATGNGANRSCQKSRALRSKPVVGSSRNRICRTIQGNRQRPVARHKLLLLQIAS